MVGEALADGETLGLTLGLTLALGEVLADSDPIDGLADADGDTLELALGLRLADGDGVGDGLALSECPAAFPVAVTGRAVQEAILAGVPPTEGTILM